jgi:hypothetical protein
LATAGMTGETATWVRLVTLTAYPKAKSRQTTDKQYIVC